MSGWSAKRDAEEVVHFALAEREARVEIDELGTTVSSAGTSQIVRMPTRCAGARGSSATTSKRSGVDAGDHDPLGVDEMIDGGDVEALGEARLVAEELRDSCQRSRST